MKVPEIGCEPGVRKVFNEEAWCDVEDMKNYTVALPSFLARGLPSGLYVQLSGS